MSEHHLLPYGGSAEPHLFQGWPLLSFCRSVKFGRRTSISHSAFTDIFCYLAHLIKNISATNSEVTHLLHSTDSSRCPLGDFSDPVVALWSSKTFQLLSRVTECGPIHDAAFSPSAASQLACVGEQGVFFCFIHTRGLDVDLKVKNNTFHHYGKMMCSYFLDQDVQTCCVQLKYIKKLFSVCKASCIYWVPQWLTAHQPL